MIYIIRFLFQFWRLKKVNTARKARKGTGSRSKDGVVTKPYCLTLDARTVAYFEALGDGDRSLGARSAVRILEVDYPLRKK
jgi:hypothetical protein